MPIYEYRCKKCGFEFDTLQTKNGLPETKCPKCKNIVQRLFSLFNIQFKGSGFYSTDNPKKS